MYDVVQNFDRLDLTLLKRSMTRHGSGLYVLPRPVAMEDAAKIDPETLRRLLGLLKAAFPAVVIDTSKGLQSSDFVAFEMADMIPGRRPARPDLPAEHGPAAPALPAIRGARRERQAGGEPRRVDEIGDQPEEGRGDAEEPISWQIPNATKSA